MCLVKTPKVKTPSSTDPKQTEPTVIRNPYLDGVGPAAKAKRLGRSSLRISRTAARSGSIKPSPNAPPIAALRPSPTNRASLPGSTPVRGGGGLMLNRIGTSMYG